MRWLFLRMAAGFRRQATRADRAGRYELGAELRRLAATIEDSEARP